MKTPESEAWTMLTLVSRVDAGMREAVSSAMRWRPWEYRLYFDPVVLGDTSMAKKIVEDLHRRLSPETRLVLKDQAVTSCEDHHDDVVRAVHTAILESSLMKALWLDDDDLMLRNPSELLPLMSSDVGMVYGDVEQRFPNGSVMYQRGAREAMRGSVILYNRDALAKVYRNIDVWRPRQRDSPRDYGYFWDYKIAYWLRRYGYELRHHSQLLSVQNVNPNPGEKRRSLYQDWPLIVERMGGEKI